MCVIIVMNKKLASLEILKQCEERNGDGGGVSWIENDMVRYKKGIKSEEIFDIITEKGAPCVAHFRISTTGGVSSELCHPFIVSKKSPNPTSGSVNEVLFHNGVWSKWDRYMVDSVVKEGLEIPGGIWSDSRALAWYAAIKNKSFLGFIGQKIAIQSKRGIDQWGDFEEKDGISYSNTNWVPFVSKGIGAGCYGGELYNRKGKYHENYPALHKMTDSQWYDYMKQNE